MLGTLFVVFLLGIIAAFVIGTVGDDISHLLGALRSRLDADERAFRKLRSHVRRL